MRAHLKSPRRVRMRIEYQLTHEDYAEATRHRRVNAAFMACALWTAPILILLMQIVAPEQALAPSPNALLFLVPWFGGMVSIFVVFFHTIGKSSGKPWRRRF